MQAQDLCPHFGDCRGCQSQDLTYTKQLTDKSAALAELFAPYWDAPIPVKPSPVTTHYRNKVDPSFAGKHYDEAPAPDFVRETILGFKKRWYWPLEIQECRIAPEGFGELLGAVRIWYRAQGLGAYDSRKDEGFLRHLLVRDTKRANERMVVLITSEGALDRDSFVRAVLGAYPATSIQHGINRSRADVAFAEEVEVLHGTAHITERLHIPGESGVRELSFRISPFSFFQTNPLATENLYGTIRAWVRRTAPSHLHDLYGGTGGIALSCAGLVEHVWSVETAASASEDGSANAEANHIENVTFVTEKVKNYLLERLQTGGLSENSAAVLDPARAGVHPKARKRLLQLAPRHVLYVSCNPKILAQELEEYLEHYRLTALNAFDLFPHTRHVEVIAEMEHRQAPPAIGFLRGE